MLKLADYQKAPEPYSSLAPCSMPYHRSDTVYRHSRSAWESATEAAPDNSASASAFQMVAALRNHSSPREHPASSAAENLASYIVSANSSEAPFLSPDEEPRPSDNFPDQWSPAARLCRAPVREQASADTASVRIAWEHMALPAAALADSSSKASWADKVPVRIRNHATTFSDTETMGSGTAADNAA